MNDEPKMLHSVDDVTLLNLPYYQDDSGDLTVLEGSNHVPFKIARVFVVRAEINAIRGQHAHKNCAQFIICPYGKIEVVCDDGGRTVTYIINEPDVGLLIPPGIWAQETYLTQEAILTVLCNRSYEPHDYIRNYDEFINYRKADKLLSFKQERR